MGVLSRELSERIGFASLGQNVAISDRASFYGAGRISIGDNTRIDDFCILSAGAGGIAIGQHVHIAAYSSLIGVAAITLRDFAGLSSRVSIYSSTDDYSGAAMTNPTVPADYTNVFSAPVDLGKHVIIGAGSIILPGVTLGEGAAIGALSLVKRDCEPFMIYSGSPARPIGERKRDLLGFEARLLQDLAKEPIPPRL